MKLSLLQQSVNCKATKDLDCDIVEEWESIFAKKQDCVNALEYTPIKVETNGSLPCLKLDVGAIGGDNFYYVSSGGDISEAGKIGVLAYQDPTGAIVGAIFAIFILICIVMSIVFVSTKGFKRKFQIRRFKECCF